MNYIIKGIRKLYFPYIYLKIFKIRFLIQTPYSKMIPELEKKNY